MTQEDIIRMAGEAGDDWDSTLSSDKEFLKRFAALVAAAEREACAVLAENRILNNKNNNLKIGHHHACKSIAEAIRARGQA